MPRQDDHQRTERQPGSEPARQRPRIPVWPETEPAFDEDRLSASRPRPQARPRFRLPDRPQPPDRPRPPARPRRRTSLRWLIVPAAVVALLLVVLLAAAYIEWRSRGYILDNVYIANVPVGGMTPDEAVVALRIRYEPFQDYPVTLIYGDRLWRPQGQDIGIAVAWEDSVAEAMGLGRGDDALTRWRQRWQSWTGRFDLPLLLWRDEPYLRAYLEDLAWEVNVPPLDAALTVDGQQVEVRAGREGRLMEVVPTQRDIEDALLRLSRQPVSLVVQTIPPEVDDEAVKMAMGTARQMLSAPVILNLDERSWTLTPEQIGQMIRIERRPEGGASSVVVMLDQAALRSFIAEIANEVRILPRNAHFRFIDGHLQITDEGAAGLELQVERGIAQVNEVILADRRTVQLVALEMAPKINRETIDELGIQGVVGLGQTYFGGSSAWRLHNIVTAVRILDGTLIAPGETFSFIRTIGPIDESDGFVPGYSIVGGRTVLNIGGGVCQVSTTVFRAAFWAGLPITERHAHNFRVSWYEHDAPLGMDAAIFTETGTDLRFTNNTAGHMLLQFEIYTATGNLYAYLYGTPPDYEIVLDGAHLSNWTPAPTEPVYVDNPNLPAGVIRQTDWAQGGVDSTIYRVILRQGKEIARDTFFSRYQAWPNIYERGTGTP